MPAHPTHRGLYELSAGSPYIGGYPDRQLHGRRYLGVFVQWQRPIESPDIGCPGAWYRTPFINSLYPYMRKRTASGGRVSNPLFDGADWRIQQAIMYFETEQERWQAYIADVQLDRMKADADNKNRGRNGSR